MNKRFALLCSLAASLAPSVRAMALESPGETPPATQPAERPAATQSAEGQPAATQAAPPAVVPDRVEQAAVLVGFRAHLEAGVTDVDPRRVQFVLRQMDDRAKPPAEAPDGAAKPQSADPLADWLAVLSDDFKQGLDLAGGDKPDQGDPILERLTEAADPYLAVNAAIYAAQQRVAQERIRDANALLERVLAAHPDATRYTARGGEFVFLLGYTRLGMIDYGAAERTLSQFLDQYPDAAERFRSNARQILTELESRRPEQLGDVYDLMTFARRELSHGATDEQVEQRQDEAVKLLDKLIQKAEDNEKSGKGSGSGKGSKKNSSRNRSKQQAGNPSNRSSMPQSAGDDEARKLQRARLARPGDAWGSMPQRQREQILQSLQKSFPSRYRELVEQYYRELAREPNQP